MLNVLALFNVLTPYPQNPHLISLYSLITKSLLYTLKLIHRIITWFSIAYSQKPYFLPNCYFTKCSRWRGPGTRKPYSSYRMTIFSHTKFVNFKIRVLRYCWNFFRIFVITKWKNFPTKLNRTFRLSPRDETRWVTCIPTLNWILVFSGKGIIPLMSSPH